MVIYFLAFKEFAHYKKNITEPISKLFPDFFHDIRIKKKVLPVSWKYCENFILRNPSFNQEHPSCMIILGMHEREWLSLEINSLNFYFGKDINGIFKFGRIFKKAPILIKTNVGFNSFFRNSILSKVLKVSIYPGIYLCNFVYYLSLYSFASKFPIILIHVPKKVNLNQVIEIIKLILIRLLKCEVNKKKF